MDAIEEKVSDLLFGQKLEEEDIGSVTCQKYKELMKLSFFSPRTTRGIPPCTTPHLYEPHLYLRGSR